MAAADGSAQQFGLGATQGKASLQGREILAGLADSEYQFDVDLNGIEHEVSGAVEDGTFAITLPQSTQGLISAQIVSTSSGRHCRRSDICRCDFGSFGTSISPDSFGWTINAKSERCDCAA